MALSTVFASLCLAASIWALIDALKLFLFWKPAAGVVIATTYSEAERLAARAAHPWDWLYKVTTGNAKPVVKDLLKIRYEAGGQTYRQQVATAHLRGDKANPTPVVWYDQTNPERVTLDGPGKSLLAAMVFLGLASWSAGILSWS